MLIEQRIMRTVERHVNYGFHPTAVLLPDPDYDKLLRELAYWYWFVPGIAEPAHGERLFLECIHGRLMVLRRPGGKVYWQWEFKAR